MSVQWTAGQAAGLQLYVCSPAPVSSQRKQLEIERAEKWLKMVKKWDKYKSSDRVSSSPRIPDPGPVETESVRLFPLKRPRCWRVQTITDKNVKCVLVYCEAAG